MPYKNLDTDPEVKAKANADKKRWHDLHRSKNSEAYKAAHPPTFAEAEIEVIERLKAEKTTLTELIAGKRDDAKRHSAAVEVFNVGPQPTTPEERVARQDEAGRLSRISLEYSRDIAEAERRLQVVREQLMNQTSALEDYFMRIEVEQKQMPVEIKRTMEWKRDCERRVKSADRRLKRTFGPVGQSMMDAIRRADTAPESVNDRYYVAANQVTSADALLEKQQARLIVIAKEIAALKAYFKLENVQPRIVNAIEAVTP